MRITGLPVESAIPSAIYPADRSSGIIYFLIFACRANARVNGADLDPGEITAVSTPRSLKITGMEKIHSKIMR